MGHGDTFRAIYGTYLCHVALRRSQALKLVHHNKQTGRMKNGTTFSPKQSAQSPQAIHNVPGVQKMPFKKQVHDRKGTLYPICYRKACRQGLPVRFRDAYLNGNDKIFSTVILSIRQ